MIRRDGRLAISVSVGGPPERTQGLSNTLQKIRQKTLLDASPLATQVEMRRGNPIITNLPANEIQLSGQSASREVKMDHPQPWISDCMIGFVLTVHVTKFHRFAVHTQLLYTSVIGRDVRTGYSCCISFLIRLLQNLTCSPL